MYKYYKKVGKFLEGQQSKSKMTRTRLTQICD